MCARCTPQGGRSAAGPARRAVWIWAREVREASYDMEDLLDTFLVSAHGDHEHTDPKSLFERLKRKMAGVYDIAVSGPLKRRRIAITIDDINKRLQEVTERHWRYTLDSIVAKPSPTSAVDPRLAAMYNEVTQLVGIDKPISKLWMLLALRRDELKMVSVVGVGGLGKTTLAKTVYDKVKMHFMCGAFVPVGQNPDLKKVFRDVLIELDKKYVNSDITILDERQLIDELRKYLENKRYVLATQCFTLMIWGTNMLFVTQTAPQFDVDPYKCNHTCIHHFLFFDQESYNFPHEKS